MSETPTNITANRQTGEMSITWSDGVTCAFSFKLLRAACPGAIIVILISHMDARQQAALSAGADVFISKGESPERVAERLRGIAESVTLR